MPKDTFLNLKSEKKEKIEKAITDEFTKNSFEQVSISNIIQRAQIPRGSFYQYFEDKKDAVQYIIQKFIFLNRLQMFNNSKGHRILLFIYLCILPAWQTARAKCIQKAECWNLLNRPA